MLVGGLEDFFSSVIFLPKIWSQNSPVRLNRNVYSLLLCTWICEHILIEHLTLQKRDASYVWCQYAWSRYIVLITMYNSWCCHIKE
jgi:hypothetical protein